MDNGLNKELENVDTKVVKDFGMEWQKFNHKEIQDTVLLQAFNQYFHIFPFEKLAPNAEGFDMGCGSGRWAKLVAKKVGKLHCVDASEEALLQAKNNLKDFPNCDFECASVSNSSIAQDSQDFGYCLGVLHHIPDTLQGLKDCVSKLKNGSPFLLYLYYKFDNKPSWYKFIWKISDYLRRYISKMPFKLKLFVSQLIAIFIYFPLAKLAFLFQKFGFVVANFPLSDYRDKSLYFMRTDALDRFGTRLEKRFTKDEIHRMMEIAGLTNIQFSNTAPFWVAVGYKK